MIAIVDYGMGNLSSIQNMIRKVGGESRITSDLDEISLASALILPGVGSFDNGMEKLQQGGFVDAIRENVLEQRVPFLGICLGMQLLFEGSEEGDLPGLGLIPGTVRRFRFKATDASHLKVPHMGWNLVSAREYQSLFKGLEAEARFYFVHSYHVQCADEGDRLGTTQYGHEFASAVNRDNIYGVQFHPEKSHRFGMTLMKNYLEIASGC